MHMLLPPRVLDACSHTINSSRYLQVNVTCVHVTYGKVAYWSRMIDIIWQCHSYSIPCYIQTIETIIATHPNLAHRPVGIGDTMPMHHSSDTIQPFKAHTLHTPCKPFKVHTPQSCLANHSKHTLHTPCKPFKAHTLHTPCKPFRAHTPQSCLANHLNHLNFSIIAIMNDLTDLKKSRLCMHARIVAQVEVLCRGVTPT